MQPLWASMSWWCLPSLFTRLYRVTSSSFTATIRWSRQEELQLWLQLRLVGPLKVSSFPPRKNPARGGFGEKKGLEVK